MLKDTRDMISEAAADIVQPASAGQEGPHMRRCSRCGRHFPNRAAADSHIRDVHKGKGYRVSAAYREPEQSYADMVVDAQIARACGELVDPVIADMFDV